MDSVNLSAVGSWAHGTLVVQRDRGVAKGPAYRKPRITGFVQSRAMVFHGSLGDQKRARRGVPMRCQARTTVAKNSELVDEQSSVCSYVDEVS